MPDMNPHQNYIGGRWVPPRNNAYYETRNPACPREVVGNFPRSGAADAEAATAAAEAAKTSWEETQAPQRAAVLYRFARLLEQSKEELGRIVTREQGKALGEATGEVARAAAEAHFAAGESLRLSGQTFPSERANLSCY